MALNERRHNFLNFVVRCYDRSLGAARLDPLDIAFQLDAEIPALVRDVEELRHEGLLDTEPPGTTYSGAEMEWMLAPTDKGLLTAMGIGEDAPATWPEDEGGLMV